MQQSRINILDNLKDQFIESYNEILESIVAYVPSILISILVLIIGYFLAYSLEMLVSRIINKIDFSFSNNEVGSDGRRYRIKQYYSFILGKIVFWVVILFSLLTIANILDIKIISDWTNEFIHYLPRLASGMAIILSGFIVSNITYVAVMNTSKSFRGNKTTLPARVLQFVVIFTSTIVGLEHIGVNSYLLNNILITIIGISFAGFTLAFGLGAKGLVANIIGAQYAKKHCKIGYDFAATNIKGVILEVTNTSIIIKTGDGISVVPAKLFTEEISFISVE